MKVYTLKRTQLLPITLDEAWEFFSSPRNLVKITPPFMRFQVQYASGGDKMYAGQIIRYKLYILPNVPSQWVTEITHVQEPHFFIDEQRDGPYALWHHQHRFRAVAGGVQVEDEVNYALPLGLLGRLAHVVFVERTLNAIFNHRFQVLASHFAQAPEAQKNSL